MSHHYGFELTPAPAEVNINSMASIDGAVAEEISDDVYAIRAHDRRPTLVVPLVGEAPDEEIVERWSVALTVEVDPDRVFTRSGR